MQVVHTRLLHGETRITARTAILLSRRFGSSAEFWMNLQMAHDLEVTRAEMAHADPSMDLNGEITR